MEKTKRCPHCNSKSIRRWLSGGYVKCLDCDKISKYSDWKEDEEFIVNNPKYVDMHDVLIEYISAAGFMPIKNPKIFTGKKCPICNMVHLEAEKKKRYIILMIFYHVRVLIMFYRAFRKIQKGYKRISKGKDPRGSKRDTRRAMKQLRCYDINYDIYEDIPPNREYKLKVEREENNETI